MNHIKRMDSYMNSNRWGGEKMQEDYYNIFRFRYIDKKARVGFVVYAREEETADKIISIVNKKNVFFFTKPKIKWRFKKAKICTKPPYEIEQEQFEVAESQYEIRSRLFASKRNGGK